MESTKSKPATNRGRGAGHIVFFGTLIVIFHIAAHYYHQHFHIRQPSGVAFIAIHIIAIAPIVSHAVKMTKRKANRVHSSAIAMEASR